MMNELGLKGLADKIEELTLKSMESNSKIFNIGGRAYTESNLTEIKEPIYTPDKISVSSLKSLCDIIKAENDKIFNKTFIRIASPTKVDVFTEYDSSRRCIREYHYECFAQVPNIYENNFTEHEAFIINLLSNFIESDDTHYILDLISRIAEENTVETNDNGFSQSVSAKRGVGSALYQSEKVRSRVLLRPYRTFIEAVQPESYFLLRLDKNSRIGLFEADGGAWKIQAKENIADFLNDSLQDLIEQGRVIVLS